MMRKISLIILAISLPALVVLFLNRQPAGAATPQLGCNPTVLTVKTGQTFYYTVAVTDTEDVYAWQFDMSFNPTYLEFIGVIPGNHLVSDGASGYFVSPTSISNEVQLAAYTRLSEHVGVNGNGNIAHVYFRAIKATSGTNGTLNGILLLDRNALDVDFDTVNSLRCKVIISDSAPVYAQPGVGHPANLPLIDK
ncbi:MAG: hypothetical protein JW908_03295 [Anaerolineales bacterium]|nr:hypothetical protein [Anaerolineales bacterium]